MSSVQTSASKNSQRHDFLPTVERGLAWTSCAVGILIALGGALVLAKVPPFKHLNHTFKRPQLPVGALALGAGALISSVALFFLARKQKEPSDQKNVQPSKQASSSSIQNYTYQGIPIPQFDQPIWIPHVHELPRISSNGKTLYIPGRQAEETQMNGQTLILSESQFNLLYKSLNEKLSLLQHCADPFPIRSNQICTRPTNFSNFTNFKYLYNGEEYKVPQSDDPLIFYEYRYEGLLPRISSDGKLHLPGREGEEITINGSEVILSEEQADTFMKCIKEKTHQFNVYSEQLNNLQQEDQGLNNVTQ